MSQKNKRARALLAGLSRLYEMVPPVNCEGKCQHSCQGLGDAVAPIELARIRKFLANDEFVFPRERECSECPLLGTLGECLIHQVRPLICRLYGVVKDRMMVCPHGCHGRKIDNSDARELWNRVLELSSAYESELKLGASYGEAVGDQSTDRSA